MNPPPPFDPALLALLRCPETRQPLAIAPAGLIARLESARSSGTLTNRAGQPLTEPITEGLLRTDGKVFFRICAAIPLLVSDEAVVVPQV